MSNLARKSQLVRIVNASTSDELQKKIDEILSEYVAVENLRVTVQPQGRLLMATVTATVTDDPLELMQRKSTEQFVQAMTDLTRQAVSSIKKKKVS